MKRYTIKDFPFVVMVIIVSVVLAIYFAISGKAQQPKDKTTAEYTQSQTETTETATKSKAQLMLEESSEDEETAETESIVESQSTEASTESTSEGSVDDSYFDDALFIGDSRTVGLYLYGSIAKDAPNATFFADVGTSLYKVTDVSIPVPPQSGDKETLEDVLNAKKYGKVYIMLGVNDLGTGSPDSFAEAYSKLIDYIKQYQPDTIIYIESMISISRDAEESNEYVSLENLTPRNQKLEALADNQQVFYLNLNEVLVDGDGYLKDAYTSDGVHLKATSLSLWENYLRTHAIVK